MPTARMSYLWMIAALLGLVLAPFASAQSMHNEQALIDGAALSANYPNTFWMETTKPDGVTRWASGVRLNDHYGIVSGHQLFETADGGFAPLNSITIGNGDNWMTNPGTTFGVSEYFLHPEWNGVIGGSSVDIAIVRFDSAWLGDDVTIGTSNVGDLLTYSGFGTPATPGLGLLEPDGQRRAFQTYLDEFGGPGGSFDDFYMRGNFYPPGFSGFLDLGGVATAGNSGGGVWNDMGELVAITAAQSLSPDYFGATFSVELQGFQPWIDSVIVPAPGSGALLLFGALGLGRRRRALLAQRRRKDGV